MHAAVGGLDDGGIAVFAGCGLEIEDVLPFGAVTGNRDAQRRAALGRVVVNEQMATVGERDGIGARIRIRHRGETHLAPSPAVVRRRDGENLPLARAPERQEFLAAEKQHTRLNRTNLESVVEKRGLRPRFPQIGRALEVDAPFAGLLVRLVARRTQQRAVGELHGLVFDRAVDAVGQAVRGAPGATAIGRGAQFAPPRLKRRADLVEKQQRPALGLEQHRIPCRDARLAVGLHAVGDLNRRGPRFSVVERHPNTDVGIFLLRAAKPRGDEAARRRLDDRRGVAFGIRRFFVDEFGPHDGGVFSGDRSRGVSVKTKEQDADDIHSLKGKEVELEPANRNRRKFMGRAELRGEIVGQARQQAPAQFPPDERPLPG